MNKNITLFGGKTITVHYEPLADGTTPADETIKVRQIPVRDYETGFAFVDDEPALVGFLCMGPVGDEVASRGSHVGAHKNKAWALTLRPDSYEEILATGREGNAGGFFCYCQRRTAQASKATADMIGVMATLPTEAMKLAMDRGLEMQAKSRSPMSSPGFVPPPAR